MKHKNRIKLTINGLTVLVLGVSFVVFLVFPGTAHVETRGVQKTVDLSALEIEHAREAEQGDPKIESILNRLFTVYRSDGDKAAAEFAVKQKIPMTGSRVKVELDVQPVFSTSTRGEEWSRWKKSPQARETAANEAAARVLDRIEQLGGQVEKSYRYLVRCNIDIRSLQELARVPQVRSIRRPIKPHPHVISEGVSLIGAQPYHKLTPFKSGGVKVCVLDAGFKHYNDLLGVELPDKVTVKSFTDTGDIEADEVHGTACAEIVYDMAPDAELYLANIIWESDILDAVNWMIQQQVDIISYSLGSYWGPGDGTGFVNTLARYARQEAGIYWVTSAGNSADDHWSGTFNDPDGDGWHNFSGEDEILQFFVPGELCVGGFNAVLKWNDWGPYDDIAGYRGSDQDYDIYLFKWEEDTNQWRSIDFGVHNKQPFYKWPYEETFTLACLSPIDAYLGVGIRKTQATKDVFFDLYIPTHDRGTLEYLVPEGSITYPANSPNIIAVGAVDAVEGYYHFYSSRGPTADGRLKPDIVAPSWVSNSGFTYGPRNQGGFAGTSASCPHMAGAMALLKSKTPFTMDEILQIIYSRAIDMGEPGPDNIFGRGRLNLKKQ